MNEEVAAYRTHCVIDQLAVDHVTDRCDCQSLGDEDVTASCRFTHVSLIMMMMMMMLLMLQTST